MKRILEENMWKDERQGRNCCWVEEGALNPAEVVPHISNQGWWATTSSLDPLRPSRQTEKNNVQGHNIARIYSISEVQRSILCIPLQPHTVTAHSHFVLFTHEPSSRQRVKTNSCQSNNTTHVCFLSCDWCRRKTLFVCWGEKMDKPLQ